MWDISKINYIEKNLLDLYNKNIKKSKIIANYYKEIVNERKFYHDSMVDGTKKLIKDCYADKKRLEKNMRENYFNKNKEGA